ncbi:reverse transcriptase [Elysia marginata]|uniref:Reverse transcriptase n=1 Tax=Elysia marginata TaxID=1093978 RepID=A0AAV4HH03_9GAST|nr:reverse transcriptase [Elysia marginata]
MEIEDEEVKTTYQYVVDLKGKIEEVIKLDQQNLCSASSRYKAHFDIRAKARSCNVGDQTLILLPTKTNKLQLNWLFFLCEDANSTTKSTICELEEIAGCCDDGQEGRKIILEQLNFMSDMAANEKKSASQMQQWLDQERPKDNVHTNEDCLHYPLQDNAVCRIVRMMSEILGPNMDERNGIRDRWLSDFRSRQENL